MLSDNKFGMPVLAFENIKDLVDTKNHYFFAAITYQNLNMARSSVLSDALDLGFKPASYVSSDSFIWRNAKIGNHCFIFENNTIQPYSAIADNCIIWSGNHIGHHSYIGKNVFISSQVVISGNVKIGENTFIGVNSTIANGVKVGKNCWINPHTLISGDLPDEQFVYQVESNRKPLDLERLEGKLREKSSSRKKSF